MLHNWKAAFRSIFWDFVITWYWWQTICWLRALHCAISLIIQPVCRCNKFFSVKFGLINFYPTISRVTKHITTKTAKLCNLSWKMYLGKNLIIHIIRKHVHVLLFFIETSSAIFDFTNWYIWKYGLLPTSFMLFIHSNPYFAYLNTSFYLFLSTALFEIIQDKLPEYHSWEMNIYKNLLIFL